MRSLVRTRLAVLSFASVVAALGAVAVPPITDAAAFTTGGLSGKVFGVSGTALAGATVRAYALPYRQEGCTELGDDSLWRVVASSTTAADGSYKLALATGYYRLYAKPPNLATNSFGFRVGKAQGDGSNVTGFVEYADDVFVPTNGRSRVNIRLTTPTSVSGTVTDPDTHAPLAGVQVRGVRGGQYGDQTALIYPAATTNASGHYVLRGLPRHVPDPRPATSQNEGTTWGLVIVDPAAWYPAFIWWHTLIDEPNTVPDVAPVDATAGNTTRNVEFLYMKRGGRVTGQVLNQSGVPVRGIQVALWMAFPYPPVLTNSSGRFTIPAGSTKPGVALHFVDPAGKYRTAFYPGAAREDQATPFYAAPGKEVHITMKLLGDAPHVTGSAWYTVGVPAAGAAVSDGSYTFVTCDGSFDVGGLWPGATTLRFIPPIPDGNPTRTLHRTLRAGRTVDVGTVELPTWVISGNVEESGTGAPVAGAQVDLMNPVSDPSYLRYWADEGVGSARAVTDDGGNFQVWLPDNPLGSPYLVVRDIQDPPRFDPQVYDGQPLPVDPQSLAGDPVADTDPWDDQGTYYTVRVQMN